MLYASAETSDSLKAHQAAMVKMLKLFELLAIPEFDLLSLRSRAQN
jgi:hypothetical protein